MRSLGPGYKQWAVIPAAGQRTHRPTFWALKVTTQMAAPGAEYAVMADLFRFVQCHIYTCDSPVRYSWPFFFSLSLPSTAVVKLLSTRRWIPTGAKLEGTKLEPKGPRVQVVLLTADQGFSSIQGILLGFYSI